MPGTGVSKDSRVDWPARLRALWPGALRFDCPMAAWCTLRVGGPARVLAEPAGLNELQSLLATLTELAVSWRVIGRGSNLLVPDRGYDGVVVVLGRKFAAIGPVEECDDGRIAVWAEAGCSLMRLVNWTVEQGLTGLEFAAGIPGSLGGAVVMNAGAWGKEMGQVISSVCFLSKTGELIEKRRAALAFSYRRLETGGMVVVGAECALAAGDRQLIAGRCRELIKKRREKQPRMVASAGSFFKNPPGLPAAGKLIEDTGLKGFRLGGAMVSEKHGNFLVNTGCATAADLLELMELVQERVFARFGIWLEPEVHILREEGGS